MPCIFQRMNMALALLLFLLELDAALSLLHGQHATTANSDSVIYELMAKFSHFQQKMETREKELQDKLLVQDRKFREQQGTLEAIKRLFNETNYNTSSSDRAELLIKKINQTLIAQGIILQDVIFKVNSHEKIVSNATKQFHEMAFSILDFDKQIQNVKDDAFTVSWANHCVMNKKVIYDKIITNVGNGYSADKDENRDVAFTVSKSTDGPLGSQKVIYDKVITNVGNGYSTHTGVFTCPRDGVYVFTWSTMSRYSNERCDAYIYRNGVQLLMAYSYEANGGLHEVASNTAALSLTVGDTVWIQSYTCGYFYAYPYTAFSGWKL